MSPYRAKERARGESLPCRSSRSPAWATSEAPLVEGELVRQPGHERPSLLTELLGLGVELVERLLQAVAAAYVGAVQRAHQLGLVVALHAERGPGGRHLHDPPEHAGRVRAAVDQVADEDRGAALGVADAVPPELGQQGLELRAAAVDVADQVVRRPGIGRQADGTSQAASAVARSSATIASGSSAE